MYGVEWDHGGVAGRYHGFAALDRHPLAIHAFGIDTSIMSRQAQGIPGQCRPGSEASSRLVM